MNRLLAALAAFFLGVGVSAHALDELKGRPLRTRLSDRTLVALAVVGLAGAVAIGIVGASVVSLSLIPFVAAGAFILVAYNLELFGGRFHSALWFALAWGAFPAFTSYWANALQVSLRGGGDGRRLLRADRSPSGGSAPRRGSCGGGRWRCRESRCWPTGRRSS